MAKRKKRILFPRPSWKNIEEGSLAEQAAYIKESVRETIGQWIVNLVQAFKDIPGDTKKMYKMKLINKRQYNYLISVEKKISDLIEDIDQEIEC